MSLLSNDGFLHANFAAFAFRRHHGQIIETDHLSALGTADTFIAVAVRNNGNMLRIGLDALAAGRDVRVLLPPDNARCTEGNRILLEHGARLLDLSIKLPPARAAPGIISDPPPDGFLWHCTRACAGPWPGQTIDEYYTSLLDHDPCASHSSHDALDRILAEKKIRACGKMIRGAQPVVCFSSKKPCELQAMRRYKPALLRWDFEPCAIGIRLNAAVAAGIRPVLYRHPDEYESLGGEERHLFQKHDPPGVDYSAEVEWRSLGDVDLNRFDEKDLFVYRGAGGPGAGWPGG